MKMGATLTSISGTGLFFLLIILSGIWLKGRGRPLNIALSAIHKLIGVAAGAFLIMTLIAIHRAAPLNAPLWIATVATGLCWLGAVATGGLLSAERPPAPVVSLMHRVIPALTLLVTAGWLFLLLT
jgi:hypothetical protein